jgi:DNA polymerase family B
VKGYILDKSSTAQSLRIKTLYHNSEDVRFPVLDLGAFSTSCLSETPCSSGSKNNNHNNECIRTLEELVSRDKGGMIISPQIGLHENVVALDYESEYANLIVNHNLSYEPVSLQQEKGLEIAVSNDNKKGLLPTVVEKFLKRRLYFKRLIKEFPK